MPLRVRAIRDDSVLRPHGVQEGDYLAHINAWSVHTRSNARVAYKTGDVNLVFRRDGQAYEIQVSTDDLGISVEDESGEVFDLSISTLGSNDSQAQTDVPVIQNQALGQRSRTPVAGSILKIIAWVFFVLSVFGSVILITDLVLVEFPDELTTSSIQFKGQIIALILVGLMSSGFFLALSYLLSHIQGQLMFVRRELGNIRQQLKK